MKMAKVALVVFAVLVFCIVFDEVSAIAREIEDEFNTPEYHSMVATAYCLHGTTATGTQTREGVAAAKREWFGKTVNVYRNNAGEPGELIGTYTIEDTGGKAIRNGSVIDLWFPTYEAAINFGRKCVIVEILD